MTAFETPESGFKSSDLSDMRGLGVTRAASLKVFARDLWNDTRGMMLPYVTAMLVVIVGVSVLAVDGARMVSLQTQLQQAADALALAGAAELDHRSTSITRATNAIASIVTN